MLGSLLKIPLRAYAIFFVLFFASLFYFSFQKTANLTYSSASPVIVDQSLKGIKALRFDEKGQLTEILHMATWKHIQGNPISELEAPFLEIYQPDGSWFISAKNGHSIQANIHSKIEKLQLFNEVSVKRVSINKKADWELKTEHLDFHPQLSTASTQDPVVIIGQGMQIHAKGMNANLKNHTLNLLNDVKSHYVALKT